MDQNSNIIIFDCDGTLISSQEAIYQSLIILFSEVLDRPISRAEVADKYSSDLDQLNINFGLENSSEETMQDLMKRWTEINRNNTFQYGLIHEMDILLPKLKKLGFDLYVWTNRDRFSTNEVLKELGVNKYFTDMSCVDDEYRKPCSKSIKEVISTYRDFTQEKCLMIGDTETDVRSAKDFGCSSIIVDWNKYLNPDEKLGATYKATTIEECEQIILKKFKL